MHYPSYLNHFESGVLKERAAFLNSLLNDCAICPRECGVNRTKGDLGVCGSGALPKVASFNAHHGEEPPLSGTRGSGTIFFSGCNLRCVYCQNYPISQLANGEEISLDELASMMLRLQERGCHNINFVTPTHFMPQILNSVLIAIGKGLRLPLVYNTSGYELGKMVELLDGIIDIYLPDMRYGVSLHATKYSKAPDYSERNREAVKEMHRQVGDLVLDEDGTAVKGLIVRHLVLPGGLSASEEVFRFLSQEVSKNCYVSLMAQYFPTHNADSYPEIDRRITKGEYTEAVRLLKRYGLNRGWVQSI
ncbi:MAG: radical SAM protein [Candidatus Eisenbacteria bacterium]|nr:radical SAM protein [Candidatus Eisenbacteria bacterium]